VFADVTVRPRAHSRDGHRGRTAERGECLKQANDEETISDSTKLVRRNDPPPRLVIVVLSQVVLSHRFALLKSAVCAASHASTVPIGSQNVPSMPWTERTGMA